MNIRQRMARLTERLHACAAELPDTIRLMEVCGTHTVNACRSGVHSLMPPNVHLISGPGCPVCVTAQRYIDALVGLGRRPGVTLTTYGDMMRVTGSAGSLEHARSEGADVRVVTSTMEAVECARREPDRQVVFAAVGFETTAPATAAALLRARDEDLKNFFVMPCHKRVVPAMLALLSDPEIRIDGFICPGHVSVIIGAEAYRPVVEEFRRPCAVTGFEPLQIMDGILHLAQQVAAGEARLENLYPEVVAAEGNPRAQALIDRVFAPGESAWRALGVMPASGLNIRGEFAEFDALRRFGLTLEQDHDPPGCRCGDVISGKCDPPQCSLFGSVCTPTFPIGPCMVSSEGTCQAWFKYRRHERSRPVPEPETTEVMA
jgi:hydrogenase expression/formation protein HypD